MVDKFEKDGRIAVLVSPGFGAGWSTWGDKTSQEKVFCPSLVEAVLSGTGGVELVVLADKLFPDSYNGGASDLEVHWVDKGEYFRITEYDGSESLEIIGKLDHFVA